MANETEQLAKLIADINYDKIPKEVVREAKRRIADTVGIGIYSSRNAVSDKVVGYVTKTSPAGNASIWCSGKKTAPAYAAMANTGRIFYEELDDVHRMSHTHPATSTIPPALALGEAHGGSGKEIIAAIIAGYESVARIGLSVSPSIFLDRTCIPCAILSTFGAMAVAGKMMKLDADQLTGAIASASFLTPMMPVENYMKGTSIKEFCMGWGNMVGMTVVDMANYGFAGSKAGLESKFGFCNSVCASYDLNRITNGMGQVYEIMNSGIKPYAHCRQHHSAIDCVFELREKHGLNKRYKDIKHIIVRTFNPAIRGNSKEFPTISAAKYSIPYALAVATIFGDVWIEQYTEENLVNRDITGFAQKVDVVLDEELHKLYDEKWPAIVEIEMNNGEKYAARRDLMKGEPEHPLSDADLFKKFNSLATAVVSKDQAQRIWDKIFELDKMEDISGLMQELK